MSPHLHPVIVLHEVEEDMMELLMRYMYSGQVSVTEEQLVPLVQAAKDLGIKVWLINCLSLLDRYPLLSSTVCLKKTPLKDMCDFLTLKMLPLALALIKTKNRHLFDPLVRKCSFYMRI